jgi:hypothetical protein
MANLRPATNDKPATIEPTPEEQEKIEQVTLAAFLTGSGFPKGICLKVSDERILTEEARATVREGVLKLDDK